MGAGTFVLAAIFKGVLRSLVPAPFSEGLAQRRALPGVEKLHRLPLVNTLSLPRTPLGHSRRALLAALSIQGRSPLQRSVERGTRAQLRTLARDA